MTRKQSGGGDYPPSAANAEESAEDLRRKHPDYLTALENLKGFKKPAERAEFLTSMATSLTGFSAEKKAVWQQFIDDHRGGPSAEKPLVGGKKRKERIRGSIRKERSTGVVDVPEAGATAPGLEVVEGPVAVATPIKKEVKIPPAETDLARKLREAGAAGKVGAFEKAKQELRNQEKYKELQDTYAKIKAGDTGTGFKTLLEFFASIEDIFQLMGEKDSLEYKVTELFLKDHEREYEELKKSPPTESVKTPDPRRGQEKDGAVKEVVPLPDLAEYRRRWMESFPKLAVRGGTGGERVSNVDGNACLFFFRKILGFTTGTDQEKAYVDPKNIEYLKPGTTLPGAINLDTSDHVEGGLTKDLEGKPTGFIDHHGKDSPRQSSGFKKLYEYFKEARMLPEMKEADEFAVERLVQFVTYIDSYTLPKKGDRGFDRSLNWRNAWQDGHRTVFGIALAYQNEVPVEDLYEFFRHHTMAEAFTLAIDGSDESYLRKIQELGQRFYGECKIGRDRRKETTDDFLGKADLDKEHQRIVVETFLGKIVVFIQDHPERRLPAIQFASLAHGYDGTLVWRPHNNSFALGVSPDKKITPELAKAVGVGELVREGQLIQPASKEPTISLRELLERLGVGVDKLDPRSRLGKEVGLIPSATSAETPDVVAGAPTMAATEVQPELPEAVNPKFVAGDFVSVKDVPGVKKFATPQKVLKGSLIGVKTNSSNYYLLEGVTDRWYKEEWLQKASAPAQVDTREPAVPRPAESAPRDTREVHPAPSEAPTTAHPEPTPAPRIETPTIAIAEVEINVETAASDFNSARQAYVILYKEYLTKKKAGGEKKSWLKRNIFDRFKTKKGQEEEEGENPELAETRGCLDEAREKYLQAKQEYAKSLYQKKAQELARSGKTAEEIAQELEAFGQEEIFQKLIIGEEKTLQEQCVADWPPKEKGILRKAFDKWVKLPTAVRVAISTVVVAGVVAGAGGFAAVSATGIALFAGWRYARGLSSVVLAQVAGKGVDMAGQKIIEKKLKKTQAEIAAEFKTGMQEGNTDFLTALSEKQHELFERRIKMERNKLLVRVAVSIGVGVGAAYGLGMLERSYMAPAATPEAPATTPPATLEDVSKRLDEMLAAAKAKQQSLFEALRQKAEQASEAVRHQVELSHTYDLATIHKGEGVIHVLRRQLEDDPSKFGFTGDASDHGAVHAWADHEATQISIKEHYWDPKTGDQNWVRWNPKGDMRFVLEGDTSHGFKVHELGTEGRHFIHHQTEAEKMLKLDWNEEAPLARPAATLSGDAARIAHGVDEAVSRVTIDQIPTDTGIHLSGGQEIAIKDLKIPTDVPDKGFTRLADIGARHLDAPEGYRWADIAKGHAALLDAKVQAAHELTTLYAGDPNMLAAARAVEHEAVLEAQQFAGKVHQGLDLVSKDATALKAGVSELTYRGAIFRNLHDQVLRRGALVGAAEVAPSPLDVPNIVEGGQMDAVKGAYRVVFDNNGLPEVNPQGGSKVFLDALHQDPTRAGLLQADKLGEVASGSSGMLDRMVVLSKALQRLVESGQGTSKAANSLKMALRSLAEHTAGHTKGSVADIFDAKWLKTLK